MLSLLQCGVCTPDSKNTRVADYVVEPKTKPLAPRRKHRGSLPGNNLGFLRPRSADDGDSALEDALAKHRQEASELAQALLDRQDTIESADMHNPEAFAEKHCHSTYLPSGCYYFGHVNTDMDSVASAIGAAYLFDGVACRSERSLNGEITFALEFAQYDKWAGRSGVDAAGNMVYGPTARDWQRPLETAAGVPDAVSFPPFIDDIAAAVSPTSEAGLVLVDHNEPGQSPPSVGELLCKAPADKESAKAAAALRRRIKGVIDHHAVAENFKTAGPCFVDIRPWGSACSIGAPCMICLRPSVPSPG